MWREPFRFGNPIRIPHEGPVSAIDWHMGRKRYLLTACADQKIRYFKINTSSYQFIWEYDAGGQINDVVFGTSGRQAYVATVQGILGPILLNSQDIIQQIQPILSPISESP